jgi:hypothetical protein
MYAEKYQNKEECPIVHRCDRHLNLLSGTLILFHIAVQCTFRYFSTSSLCVRLLLYSFTVAPNFLLNYLLSVESMD